MHADRLRTPNEIPQAWRLLWNWLRGAPRSEGIPAPAVADAATRLAGLVSRDQGGRLAALYDLVALGEQAVAVLVEALLATAGLDRHTSPPPTDPAFHGGSPDHRHRGFTHRQFTPEDTAVALGAVGEPAVAALLELLDHDDPWMRMNAAYAIGEADPNGVCADRLGALLEDQLDAVVRAALDALCCQPSFTGVTVQRLHRTSDRRHRPMARTRNGCTVEYSGSDSLCDRMGVDSPGVQSVSAGGVGSDPRCGLAGRHRVCRPWLPARGSRAW